MPEYITTKELATRWRMSPQTLANQRSLGTGPPYLKLGNHIAYRVSDIEAYEEARIVKPVERGGE